ncbi:MAG: hypothetical protein U5K33_02175 [Halofilum sp. (in: g-proteobacteria)]|nr:hypothetical protein [Halofilum sp. (in: g-proteobacteria)]
MRRLFCAGGALTWLLFGTALPYGPGGSASTMAAQTVQKLLPAVVFIVGWARWGCTPASCCSNCGWSMPGTGEHPGWVRAGIRYIGYLVSALPLGLGFLWRRVRPRRRRPARQARGYAGGSHRRAGAAPARGRFMSASRWIAPIVETALNAAHRDSTRKRARAWSAWTTAYSRFA